MHRSNKETPHVLNSYASWVSLYSSGMSCPDIAKRFGVDKSTVHRRLKEGGVKIRSRGEVKLAALNPMWKSNKAKYGALHIWVKSRVPRPDICPNCNQRPAIDLANISPEYNPKTYTRDLENWEWLCRKCHMTKDGRLSRMYRGGSKIIYTGCFKCNRPHHCKGYCTKHYYHYRAGHYDY